MRLPPHPPTSHSAHFQKVPRQLKKGLWKQWHSDFSEHASCTGEAVQGRKQRKPVEGGEGDGVPLNAIRVKRTML